MTLSIYVYLRLRATRCAECAFYVVVREEEEGLDLGDWFCARSHGRGRALSPRDCAGRHRWEPGAPTLRRCRPSRRRLPLRRSRDAQRRLLGGGEAAQVHQLATVSHLYLEGLGPAGIGEGHAEVTRRVLGHAQRQPLHLCLLPRLLARQRCSPLRRYRLPLCGDRATHSTASSAVAKGPRCTLLATAPHLRLVGLGPARLRLLPRLLTRHRHRVCRRSASASAASCSCLTLPDAAPARTTPGTSSSLAVLAADSRALAVPSKPVELWDDRATTCCPLPAVRDGGPGGSEGGGASDGAGPAASLESIPAAEW
eukprot:scaffold9501_cov75-Phaeocystis_antarctica.AAC.10